MRTEPQHQDRWKSPDLRRRPGAPVDAARRVIVLAALRRVAWFPLRGIIVHRHFWPPDKHGEPVPVGMQATQDLLLDKVEVGLLKMRLAAGLHLAQLGLQVAVALDKCRRLLLQPQRLIPYLQTGGIETVEFADIFDPGEHPPFELPPTARGLEKVPPQMRPTKGQDQIVTG